jgi:hypothetical protein
MYVDKVTEKVPQKTKPAVVAKLTEAYNTMAAGYVNFDKGKSKRVL